MTIKEIYENEISNRDSIVLYREGIFLKAYERSAYFFVTNIAAFKPTKKYIKSLGVEVVSIGFPSEHFEKYAAKCTVTEQTELKTVLRVEPSDAKGFGLWKNSVALKLPMQLKAAAMAVRAPQAGPPVPDAPATPQSPVADLVAKIRNFNIESKTPLECMTFLAEIKKTL